MHKSFAKAREKDGAADDGKRTVSFPNGSAGAPRWNAPEYITGRTPYKHTPGDVYAWACVVMEACER
jgi:hypothetical protein